MKNSEKNNSIRNPTSMSQKKITGYVLLDGMDWNPLRDSKMRNQLCPCGSKKKTKKCHGQQIVIKADESKKIKEYMDHLEKYANKKA